jgi:hypothetical protein
MAPAKSVCIEILIALLSAIGAHAQVLGPGLEPYLAVRLTPTETDVRAPVVTNLYSAALVAYSTDYQCDGTHSLGHRGYGDAAMIYTTPVATGKSEGIPSPGPGCKGGVTTAIWADGKEMGDPDELRNIHDCRAVALEELQATLEGDILKVPPDKWEPDVTIAKLKARRAQFPNNSEIDAPHGVRVWNCRIEEIEYLTSSIEQFRSTMAKHPTAYLMRGFFLQYLRDWEKGLSSFTYPERPTWWMNPPAADPEPSE